MSVNSKVSIRNKTENKMIIIIKENIFLKNTKLIENINYSFTFLPESYQ